MSTDTKSKLEQVRKDIASLQENEKKLKMAEEEVTYSIGDRFLYNSKTKMILAQMYGKIGFIELPSGTNWGNNNTSKVEDEGRITEKEMDRIWNRGTCKRYWDARKGCQV